MQLCIPKSSLGEKIIRELYREGHFDIDKTLILFSKDFYWPKLKKDVQRFVERCFTCQVSHGTISNAGLYTPLPIPTAP